MYCEHCGAENDNDAKFCVSCGNAIEPITEGSNSINDNNISKKTKVLPAIIVAIAIITVVIIIISVLANENGFVNSNGISIGNKANEQIVVANLFEREALPINYGLFRNSFTNGKEYLKTIYMFKSNPLEFTDYGNYIEAYEENYMMKYEFLYENGDADLTVQIQEYSRDRVGEEADFDYSYYFGKNYENKNRLQVYHSYWIDSKQTEHYDDYWYYTYNENGDLTEMTDGTGDNNYYFYDGYGILSEKYYDDKSYTFTYEKDDNGNISSIAKYVNDTQRYLYEYEYDYSGRIVKETYYFFDSAKGQQLRTITSFSYDERGNIATETKEKYSGYTGEYDDTETTSYYYNDNYNLSKITITDKYSTYYLIYEYTDSPTSYEVLYQ